MKREISLMGCEFMIEPGLFHYRGRTMRKKEYLNAFSFNIHLHKSIFSGYSYLELCNGGLLKLHRNYMETAKFNMRVSKIGKTHN